MRVPCIAILLRPRIASPSRGGFPSPQFGFLIFVPLVWRLRRYWPSGLRTSVVASLPPPAILGSSVRHVPPYYVLGEGLQRSFVGRHLRLQLFLRVFYCFACSCSDVCSSRSRPISVSAVLAAFYVLLRAVSNLRSSSGAVQAAYGWFAADWARSCSSSSDIRRLASANWPCAYFSFLFKHLFFVTISLAPCLTVASSR